MIKNKLLIIQLIFLFIAFNSCKRGDSSNNKDTLSVSIEPQKYFLEKLVGDVFSINTVIPIGSNPESYDPTPLQMASIGKSIAYYKIGALGFENTWLKNIEKNNRGMKVFDCSEGIKPIEHSDSGHAHGDPHIWSSPKTALRIIENMYNSLIELDIKNKDYYSDNLKLLKETINQTDSLISLYLSSTNSNAFIIYHPALSYFADEYNLKQFSIEVEGKSPTPKQLANLIEEAKKNNVKIVFVQEEFDKKNAEIIARELGAEVVPINLLSYNWNEEMIKIAKAIAQIK